jgi:hypothetical protein
LVNLPRAPSASLHGATAPVPLIKLDQRTNVLLRAPGPIDNSPSQPMRRSKIWELAQTLHCSIIGTCLSNAELRHVLVRLKVPGADVADEHELHVLGVTLAGRRDAGAKLVQKALDRRHEHTIKQFGRAKDAEALRHVWEDAVQRGEIPGAYWALLSHPAASEAIVKKAFQHVHMLSHLVGAANRADIRRLRQLEDENAGLIEKVHRQQQQLRDGFTARDHRIRQLNELLVRQVEHSRAAGVGPENRDEIETLRTLIADLSARLGQETARRERLEQRLNTISTTLKKTEAGLQTAQGERDSLRRDLDLFEDRIVDLLAPTSDNSGAAFDLSSRTIVYVGGRPHQVPQLKALVESAGGCFLHHDGGIEHNLSLLPGLVSRADVLYFPIDCISHNAVATIKRLCRQSQKPYQPLRTASLAALMAALATVFFGEPVAAE